jgi:hypothetical protein
MAMISNKKSFLLTRLFGPDYVTDERVKAGADQAGDYSFIFVSFLLWLSLIYALVP